MNTLESKYLDLANFYKKELVSNALDEDSKERAITI